MQTELEKTQLEIAKLQLEQERQKLAQMQRRQQTVQGLGQGAAAVGGAAKKGALWVLLTALGAVLGGLIGFFAPALLGTVKYLGGKTICYAPGAGEGGLLYNVGCYMGEGHTFLPWIAAAAGLYGAYLGHLLYRESSTR